MIDTGHPDPLGHADDGVTPESDALYAAEEALGLLLHDAPRGEFSLQRAAWNQVRVALGMPVLPDPAGVAAPAEPFGLVRSIIHECPALKLPQTFLQKLGMTAPQTPTGPSE